MIKKLEVNQNRFYKNIKKGLILSCKSPELNIFTYLSNSEKFSFIKMQNTIFKRNLLKLIFVYLKNTLSFFYHYEYTVHKNSLKKDNKKLIITWGKLSDFNKKGEFTDRYLGLKSHKEKKTLWVVQYDENFLPHKIANNIIIFKQNEKKIFYFFYIIKIFRNIKNKLLFLENLSSSTLYAINFHDKISKEIVYNKISKVLMPYEGQLIQRYFIKKIKKKILDITGYIHTYPQPIPFNLFNYNCCSPQKLIVSSKSLKKTLIDFFNWKKNQISIQNSPRFFRNKKINMTKKIFLPYQINESDKLLLSFSNYLKKIKDYKLPNFQIMIHPAKNHETDHILFKNKLQQIIIDNKIKFTKKPKDKTAIFFGYTSAIIEALERGANVVQICSEPILEIYTPLFTHQISCKRINKFIYSYRINKKNSLIQMQNNI